MSAPFKVGHTYMCPFALSPTEVRILPFKALALGRHDDTLVVGTVTLPDGTTADGAVPLKTLRRDT